MKSMPSDYLKITETKIFNEKVSKDIKIDALGDLHICDSVTDDMTDFLFYQINKDNPDYICLLGDNIDTPGELKKLSKRQQLLYFLTSLSNIAPVMIILGSHDYVESSKLLDYNEEFWQEVASIHNVFLLNNQTYLDKNIFFMGYFQKFEYFFPKHQRKEDLEFLYNDLKKWKQLYTSLPNDVPKIGLLHSPDYWQDARVVELLKDYDLLLSGHYHEGAIPAILDDIILGNGGIISPKKTLFPLKARGLSTLSTGTKMLISGGVTKFADNCPVFFYPFNYLCYHHMDTILLTGDKNSVTQEITRKKIKY